MDDQFPPKMEISFIDDDNRQTLFYEKVTWTIDNVQKGQEYIIEVARVRTVVFSDWEQLVDITVKIITLYYALTCRHPVTVTQQGIDLTVMAHVAVWLCTVP